MKTDHHHVPRARRGLTRIFFVCLGWAVTISQALVAQCDLIVTDISWSPAYPTVGDAVTFSATIQNVGTAATPDGVVHGIPFYVDGTAVSWSDTYTQSMAPGESVILTATGGPAGTSTWTATEGTHTVFAAVDDINRIAESDETNNQFSE